MRATQRRPTAVTRGPLIIENDFLSRQSIIGATEKGALNPDALFRPSPNGLSLFGAGAARAAPAQFNPRPDAGRLVKRDLAIDPEPKRREETVDRFGNLVTRIDFDGLSEVFSIESRFELDVAFAPAQASAAPPALPWPRDAGGPNAAYLATAEIDGALRAFALKLATACAGAPLAFLDRLNETLFTQIRHDIRPEGPARPPEETLKLGHGACRDVTNLFLAACRSLGVPARFVSGYQAHADTPDGDDISTPGPRRSFRGSDGAPTIRPMGLPCPTDMSPSRRPPIRPGPCPSRAGSLATASPRP